MDPSSQSTAHAEACSAIVERADMEAMATFATSSDVRVKEEIPGETGFFLLVVERIVADSGIFRIFAG